MRLILHVETDIGEGLSDVWEVPLPDGGHWDGDLEEKVIAAVDSAWEEAERK